MTPRRKRLFVVLAILAGVGASVSLAVVASRENIMFYYDPSQIAAGQAPLQKRFRVGGMVVKGSVSRKPGDLQVRFVLTDFAHQVPVEYTGVLPDLFREGQGIIAHGTHGSGRSFRRGRGARQARREVHAAGSGRLAQAEVGRRQHGRPQAGGLESIHGPRARRIRSHSRFRAQHLAGVLRLGRRLARQAGVDERRAPGGGRTIRVRRHGVRLSRVLVREQRLFGALRRAQLQLEPAAVL